MNINATVIVQAFNFFIVYWMLRLFLFKPVIALIEQDSAQEASLLDMIDQQKKSLEIQERERQRIWLLCQEYFIAHRPLTTSFSFSDATENDLGQQKQPSVEMIAGMVTGLQTALEEKIKHVH
jgi:hypothetical protein